MTAYLQRYNVGRRLGVAFGILILLSSLLVATGLVTMANARQQFDFIVLDRMAKIQIGNGMLDANSSILIALGTYAMATSDELNNEALTTIKAQRQRYSELRAKLDTLPSSEEGRKIRAEMDARRAISGKINDRSWYLPLKTIMRQRRPCSAKRRARRRWHGRTRSASW